jgi:hypothetical protein
VPQCSETPSLIIGLAARIPVVTLFQVPTHWQPGKLQLPVLCLGWQLQPGPGPGLGLALSRSLGFRVTVTRDLPVDPGLLESWTRRTRQTRIPGEPEARLPLPPTGTVSPCGRAAGATSSESLRHYGKHGPAQAPDKTVGFITVAVLRHQRGSAGTRGCTSSPSH